MITLKDEYFTNQREQYLDIVCSHLNNYDFWDLWGDNPKRLKHLSTPSSKLSWLKTSRFPIKDNIHIVEKERIREG